MKIIKYKIYTPTKTDGFFTEISMPWNEKNEQTALNEAFEGEYVIEDDGKEEEQIPSTEERLLALEAALLELIVGGGLNG